MKTINEVLDEAKEEHYRREAAKLLAKAEHCRQKVLIADRRERLLKARSSAKPLVLFFIKQKTKQATITKALLNKIRSI